MMSKEISYSIFALGNPLLDIIADVDKQFLEKWSLEPNNAIRANDEHIGLEDDLLKNYSLKYIPGGSSLNTIRIIQWLFSYKWTISSFAGCIGKDKYGHLLREECEKMAINCLLEEDDSDKTGHCFVLLTNNGANRSLCTYLEASNNLQEKYILQNWSFVEKAKIYYITGYIITSPSAYPAIKAIAEYSDKTNKTLCFNISATFVCKNYSQRLLELFPFIDILFANDEEILSYAEIKNWSITDIKEIIKAIINESKEKNKQILIIVTQGCDPVYVGNSNLDDIVVFPIKPIDTIVDTNGAGDAFVAGFLSQYVLNKPLEKCIDFAINSAQMIIRQNGCALPNNQEEIKFN